MEKQSKKQINSVEFMKLWKKYDKNNSGQLDKTELDTFLADWLKRKGEKSDPKSVKLYKDMTLQRYDVDGNKKIDIEELARLLPVEDNFLAKFPSRQKLTRDDFNQIFKHYDTDGSRLISNDELMALLNDLFKRNGQKINPSDLEAYTKTIREIYDLGSDKKLSLDDVGMLLSKTM